MVDAKRRRSKSACVSCSKAHTSCEENRPCRRCVRKGIQSSCVDVQRKKSKYLGRDIDRKYYSVFSGSSFDGALGNKTDEIVKSGIDLFQKHFPVVPYRREKRDLSITWDSKTNQHELKSDKASFPDIMDKFSKNFQGHLISLSLNCQESVDGPVRYYENSLWEHSLRYNNGSDIYRLVNRPLSHTPGFHHLFNYLCKRFSRNKLIQISKELSQFRPIFFECSIELTEEDLIFMEQGYQRTLLEYSKMIFKIGTPTCIWRRSGQISFLNEEFELLTGWKRKQLLDKMTFIVEILDDDAVIDYFKTFSRIAYKDYKGSEIMYECKLLTPIQNVTVNCMCIWTMRRDVTGLPLMVVGNFMPLF